MKKIIANCCEKIIVEEKDLKERIYKKRGYIFEWEIDSKLKFTGGIFSLHKTFRKEIIGKYKLMEDLKLKYIICPVCKEICWLNKPLSDWFILQNYKTKKISQKETKWAEWMN